jgi:hypothetical protein
MVVRAEIAVCNRRVGTVESARCNLWKVITFSTKE